eukprot:g45127.t1
MVTGKRIKEQVYRSACALTVHAIARHSPDVIKHHAAVALPLAFLGMHEITDEDKGETNESDLWTEVWQENVPGGGKALGNQEEELLKAVDSVVVACSAELQKAVPDQPSIDAIIQVMLKECHKENLRYKMLALKSTANILQATKEDRFKDLVDILFPVIKK